MSHGSREKSSHALSQGKPSTCPITTPPPPATSPREFVSTPYTRTSVVTQEIASEALVPKPGLCWLEAPAERSPAFLPAFARVSFAVQSALRGRMPEAYFDDIRSFEDTKRAFPMLVY